MPPTLTSAEPRPVTSADVEQIPYERPVPWYAQRRSFYIIVFMMLLNAVATTSVTWGPPTLAGVREWRAARRAKEQQARAAAAQAAAQAAALQKKQALQQKLLEFAAPDGHVAYTEDPAEAERLLLSGQGYSTVRGQQPSGSLASRFPHLPVLWDGGAELRQALSEMDWKTTERGGTVFLHERRTPSGRSRLVWVRVSATRTIAYEAGNQRAVVRPQRSLVTYVAAPAGHSGEGGYLWSHTLGIEQPESRYTRFLTGSVPSKRAGPDAPVPPSPPAGVLRVLAGRPDPKDATHFTIDYVLDGQPGVIDGWLQNDDRVRLEPRQGAKRLSRLDSRGGEEYWDPYGTAAKASETAPEASPASSR